MERTKKMDIEKYIQSIYCKSTILLDYPTDVDINNLLKKFEREVIKHISQNTDKNFLMTLADFLPVNSDIFGIISDYCPRFRRNLRRFRMSFMYSNLEENLKVLLGTQNISAIMEYILEQCDVEIKTNFENPVLEAKNGNEKSFGIKDSKSEHSSVPQQISETKKKPERVEIRTDQGEKFLIPKKFFLEGGNGDIFNLTIPYSDCEKIVRQIFIHQEKGKFIYRDISDGIPFEILKKSKLDVQNFGMNSLFVIKSTDSIYSAITEVKLQSKVNFMSTINSISHEDKIPERYLFHNCLGTSVYLGDSRRIGAFKYSIIQWGELYDAKNHDGSNISEVETLPLFHPLSIFLSNKNRKGFTISRPAKGFAQDPLERKPFFEDKKHIIFRIFDYNKGGCIIFSYIDSYIPSWATRNTDICLMMRKMKLTEGRRHFMR